MHIHILAVGQKMPGWVTQACDEFLKRMPRELQLKTTEVPLIKRGKNSDIERIKRDEGRKLLDAVPAGASIVVLDVTGKKLSTEALATNLDQWMAQGQDVAIIIGGPDGLSDEVLSAARQKISLSELTFPHPLVRVILVEQLYRAWTIINNHPYHRS